MAFSRHPHARDRVEQNTAALRAAGLDPSDIERFFGIWVKKGDRDYNKDRQMANQAYQAYPLAIAYCLGPSDIQWCLTKSSTWNRSVVCRSGGHSTAGYCVIDERIVIDMTYSFNHVIVADDGKYAVVGTGLNFGALNQTLSAYGLHVPGGGCPDVRVGGYMQGGGYGFTSRQFGMNSDNVMGFSMMLWNGGILWASPSSNADLYWAVRGGTGNNFGVVMWVQYKLQPLSGLWGVWLQWPLDSTPGTYNAAKALALLQQDYMNSPTSDRRFGYMVPITVQGPNQVPMMMVRAVFTGSRAELDNLLAPLIATGGTAPPNWPMIKFGTYADMNYELLAKPYEIPTMPVLPPGQEWAEDKQSGYIQKQMGQNDWVKILNFYRQGPPYTTVVIEPYGGFINQVPVGNSAFIHRNVSMDFFVDVFWNTASNDRPKAETYLNNFMSLMQPYFNGHQYQNYPRRGTANYQNVYWGSAYPTLTRVKRKYDPYNVFNFPQSIGYESDLSAVPTDADPWLDQPIVYTSPPQRTSV